MHPQNCQCGDCILGTPGKGYVFPPQSNFHLMETHTLSRRDQFAMAALTGMIVNKFQNEFESDLVKTSIRYADLLIAELDKEK